VRVCSCLCVFLVRVMFMWWPSCREFFDSVALCVFGVGDLDFSGCANIEPSCSRSGCIDCMYLGYIVTSTRVRIYLVFASAALGGQSFVTGVRGVLQTILDYRQINPPTPAQTVFESAEIPASYTAEALAEQARSGRVFCETFGVPCGLSTVPCSRRCGHLSSACLGQKANRSGLHT
jgi:hypothetical protein